MKFSIAAAALLAWAAPLAAQTAPYQTQAREMLERAVSFRTAKGQGQVPAMAAWLAETLKRGGVPADDIVMLPEGETTAMMVRIPGTDPSAKPILFSAHMDVVDARPEDWERSPFELVEEDGFFFGRSVLDNKTGVVSLASTILRLTKDGVKPRRTLVFGFVGDEETGLGTNSGTTRLIAGHPWVRNAEFAINTDAGGGLLGPGGKPLIYLVQGAEKTYADFTLTVTNPGGHSSRPRADNAIYQLAHALTRLEAHPFPVMANDLTRRYLDAVGSVTPGPEGAMLRHFAANPDDAISAEALSRSPEFVGTIRTTCVPTMLEAGHAPNALPQRATANINCRIFPGVSADDVRQALVAAVADPAIEVTPVGEIAQSPVSTLTPAIEKVIADAVHAAHPDVPIAPYLESGGTDGLVYRRAGIPTFASSGVFIKPEDMFAHGLNERIPVDSFYEALDHVHALAVEFGQAR